MWQISNYPLATIPVITSDNEMITGAFFARIIRINREIKATNDNSSKIIKAELFKFRRVGIIHETLQTRINTGFLRLQAAL